MTPSEIVNDVRSCDPIVYIRALGLRPEDSYGFLPLRMVDGSAQLFLYRDRPEYAQARAQMPAPDDIVRELDLGTTQLPTSASLGPSVPQTGGMAAQLAQIKSMGLVDDQMFQQLMAQTQTAGGQEFDRAMAQAQAAVGQSYDQVHAEMGGGATAAWPVAEAAPDAPPIAVHRVFPDLRRGRSSWHHLDHWIGPYRDAVGLRAEDVYGILPRGTSVKEKTRPDQNAWDAFWLVYRDRDEYAAGREAWAGTMNQTGPADQGKGRVSSFLERNVHGFDPGHQGGWPEAEFFDGVAGPGGAARGPAGGKVEVEDDRWPRARLVSRKTGTELGEALSEKIGGWGYAPEESLGFCPNDEHDSIHFAWSRR